MLGTAEERLAKRREQRRRQAQINQRAKFTADIQPGTLAMFVELQKQKGYSADALLYKLVRWGQRFGV